MNQPAIMRTCVLAIATVLGTVGCGSDKSTASASEAVATATAAVAQSSAVTAGDQGGAVAAIKKSIADNLPQLNVLNVASSVVPDMYRVELDGGEAVHVSADGKYIFNGDLLAVKQGGVENLTEVWRSEKRVAALNALKDEDLVIFPAKGDEKGVIYAFTDTSCGYCQKMHSEMDELNAKGVTVKYIAWPRYGLQTEAGQTMVNIWCSKDRLAAMTLGKTRQAVPKPEGECDNQVVLDQVALGQSLGVRGTPALFLTDGRRVGGYRPAAELAAEFSKPAASQ